MDNEYFVCYDVNRQEIVIADNNFKEVNRFHNKSWFHFLPVRKPFETKGGRAFYTSKYCDTIFGVSKTNLQPEYIIDFGASRLTKEHISKCENLDELMTLAAIKRTSRGVDNLSIWENKVFFTFSSVLNQRNMGFFCIKDLQTGELIKVDGLTKDDILGKEHPPYFMFIDSTGFYFHYDHYQIADYMESNYPLISENSNPIIINYKLMLYEKK